MTFPHLCPREREPLATIQEEADDAGLPPRFPGSRGHNEIIATQRVLEGGRPGTKRLTAEETFSVEGLAAIEQTSSSVAMVGMEARNDAPQLEKALEHSSNATRCEQLEKENARLKDMVHNQMEAFLRKKDAQNTKVQKRWRMNLKESFRQQSHKQLKDAEAICKRQYNDKLEQQRDNIREEEEQKFKYRYHTYCTKFQSLDYLTAQSKQVSQVEEELHTERESHEKLKNEHKDVDVKCKELRDELIAERAKTTQLGQKLATEQETTRALNQAFKVKVFATAVTFPADDRWSVLNDCYEGQRERMNRLHVQERIVGAEKAREVEFWKETADRWKAKTEALQRTVRALSIKGHMPAPGNLKLSEEDWIVALARPKSSPRPLDVGFRYPKSYTPGGEDA
ncbi:hypothetical protein BC567DRAFT_265617 [Phyllosticta citribraziliensis]